eukprot:TRINITY_DN2771_c0_g1_i33.p1 TRINITY_DN2771_c0_g1~~TRINITY_DN2771_c0_g1_i33.p1  ORF type:complete len:297 (-),score=67.06 TRINITY_DN2771_c0_g1_i33:417-1307(-)
MKFLDYVFFFFFKQKTAYEMLRSLVGSEMCIRDRLGGGLHLQQVTEVCGAPGIGKTQISIQFCVNCVIPQKFGGLEGDAVFIDTEGSFMIERVLDIANGTLSHMKNYACCQQDAELMKASSSFRVEDILTHLHYYRVNDHVELVALMKALPAAITSFPRRVRLIVVDSIAAPFRQDFQDMRTRTSMLQTVAQDLRKLASEHTLAVLTTNHVTTKVINAEAKIVPALGETWAHNSNCRLYCYWGGGKRHADLLKSAVCKQSTVAYSVVEAGVRDDCGLKRERDPEEDNPSTPAQSDS